MTRPDVHLRVVPSDLPQPPESVLCGTTGVSVLYGRVTSPVTGPALMCDACGPVHARAYENGRVAA